MLACAVNMFLFGGSLSKFANCRIVYGGDTVKPLEKGMSNEPIYSITSVRAYNSNSYRCQKQIKWELRKTYYALGVGSHADGVGCVGIDTGLFWPTPRRLCADTRWQQLELIHFALISCDISGFLVPKPHATIENKKSMAAQTKPTPGRLALKQYPAQAIVQWRRLGVDSCVGYMLPVIERQG